MIPREGGAGERVEREARAAARLNHPGIVAIYELASDEHDVYLVSELVRGRTLAELTRAGAISDRDVARIGIALCEALEHAHARGVIHRDVKPQNVMVLAEPAAGAGFAKLADFGVAHVASGDPLTRDRRRGGHARLHGARAGRGRARDPRLRRLLAGAHPLRGVDRHQPGQGRRPGGHRAPPGAAAAVARPRCGATCRSSSATRSTTRSTSTPARRPAPARLRAELRAAEGELADEGGLVEPATLRRVGLADDGTRSRDACSRPADGRTPSRGGIGTGVPFASRVVRAGPRRRRPRTRLHPRPRPRPLLLAASSQPGLAAVATAVLPRIGWLLAVIGLCAWLVSPDADRQGTALVLAAAAAPVPFLLPRAGVLWSVPVARAAARHDRAGAGVRGHRRARADGPLAAPASPRRGSGGSCSARRVTGRALLFGSPDGTLPRGELGGLDLGGGLGRPPAARRPRRRSRRSCFGRGRHCARARGTRPLAGAGHPRRRRLCGGA